MRAISCKFRATVRPIASRISSASASSASKRRDDLVLQVRLVHLHQQMLVAALAHQIANAFVHRDARRRHARRHRSDDRVKARRKHPVARAQNAHHLVHVELVGAKTRRAAQFCGHPLASVAVQHLHRDQHGKHGARLAIIVDARSPSPKDISRKRRPLPRPSVKINRAVVALLVCAGHRVRDPFRERRFTGHQNGLIGQTASTGVLPSHPASRSALRPYSGPSGSNVHAVSVPSSVGTPKLAEHCLRFHVARDHQRIVAVAAAHFLQQRIHRAGFGAIRDAQFVLRRRRCPARRSSWSSARLRICS